MKVLLLADPNSAHTIKWIRYLSNKGIEIYLFGLQDINIGEYKSINNLHYSTLNFNTDIFNKKDGSIDKIKYLKALPAIKKAIKEFSPDILHAHYATSYGLLGALSGFHPLIISVYGSDVYNFPYRSIIHRQILKYTLSKAEKILSTSKVMAHQTKNFTGSEIEVTPFGIDMNKFKPQKKAELFNPGDIVIGTIKALEKKYGIEYLIRAFKQVMDKHPELPLKLLIVGRGSLESHLKELTNELELTGRTIFTGYISPELVPIYHNTIDIHAALSIDDSESFGVSVLEASACSKPVVVTNVGGLPEVVEENITGIVINKADIQQAAQALERLVLDLEERRRMGINGKIRVERYYSIEDSINKMMSIYNSVVNRPTLK